MKSFNAIRQGDFITYVNAVRRPDGQPVIESLVQGDVTKKARGYVLVKPAGRRKPVRLTKAQIDRGNALYSV